MQSLYIPTIVISAVKVVTVRMSLNFSIGWWGYTLDRENKLGGETCVTVLHSS
jgi:hypothetical protein